MVTDLARGETGVRKNGGHCRPAFEGQGITDLWLAGGSCMQPGWRNCFANNSRRYRCIYRSTVVYDPAGDRQ